MGAFKPSSGGGASTADQITYTPAVGDPTNVASAMDSLSATLGAVSAALDPFSQMATLVSTFLPRVVVFADSPLLFADPAYAFAYYCDATDGNIVLDISAPEYIGQIIVVKKMDPSANTVTIQGSGSVLIDGELEMVLTLPFSCIILQYRDGWNVIGGGDIYEEVRNLALDLGSLQGTFSGFSFTAEAPASATATGTPGALSYDADFIYFCVAEDTWKRAALSTWP